MSCIYLEHDEWNGDYDCTAGTTLSCEDCRFGMGRKDPFAKCNRIDKDEEEIETK